MQILEPLKKYVPDDHSRQVVSEYYADQALSHHPGIHLVVDLGCGAGESADYFRQTNPHVKWLGIDIGSSPEVDSRTRNDAQFLTYDGIHIPLSKDSVDMIYCHQVLEHIANPRAVLKEVYRTLRPGGYFVGSTSQLEPFHAYSLWNYTTYGFSTLVGEAGLELMEIRPSIDSLTLILRTGLRRPKFFEWFWKRESPLNLLISIMGVLLRKPHSWINSMKLLFCGQFCFLVRKPTEADEHVRESDLRHARKTEDPTQAIG